MKKLVLLLFFLLASVWGFAQTTVNLADQCNCEVLSGTAVTAAGATAPAGADLGDIYVNTNTGTIYFWDGDSWEFTALETNTTNVSFAVVGTDLVITDSDGNTVSVPIADIGALTNTDDQTATEVTYDNTISGLTATNVQDAIDEINGLAGTVSLADNGDGTYDFTDAAGNVTTISDTSISTLVDNLDGTYTYTDETGATQTIDTNAGANPYDNAVSGLAATNVQDAIDEINGLAGTVSLADNGDGTYDFTDAAGNVTTISDTSISTLVDNLDGTYTYTDETGATQTIDTNAGANPYDNAVSGLAATNVQDAIDEINGLAGTVSLADNGDGTYDFTDAAGNVTTISDTSISTLVDNLDGTYTYTDETGATQTIDTNAGANPYDNAVSGLAATNVQDAIDEINGLAGTVSLADNGDGTYDFTDAAGNVTTISDTSISTLVDNLDGTYTYTDETGATQTIDTNAGANPYDNAVSGLAATNVQDAIDEINGLAGTVSLADNGDGTYDFTDAAGNVTTISDTSISTLVDNLDGTYTYTDETGATQTIDTNAGANPYDNAVSGLAATNVQDAIDEINGLAGTVSLADNGDGTYDFTDAAGNVTTISDTSISTLVDNLDGTYTYTDETGATQTIDTNAGANPYDNTTSGLAATNVQDAIDEINGLAGTVSLADNGDGTYDFTDAAGNVTTISDTSISTLVDNLDGTYTYTDETGATQTIDTNAGANPYDNAVSGLAATNVQDAIDEINGLAGTVSLADNGDGTYDFTDAAGNVTTISDTSISTLVDNLDGTYTYTDETGATQTIDTNAGANPYDNSASGLAGTDVQAAIDELAADAAADNDQVVGNEYNTSVAVNAGAVEVIDGGGTQSASLISGDANNDIVAGSDGALYLNVASVTIAETVTNITDNGDGTFTYVNENGVNQTISKSDITDNGDGTYTFTNNDGSDVILNTNAASNPYNNATSGLTATTVQAAIDEVAAGSTDDQNVSTNGTAGNITIEDGNTITLNVDDADADASNEVNTGFAVNAGNLEITDSDGTLSVPLTSLGTDDQDISTDGTAGNISIEDGSTLTLNVDDADADPTNEYNTGIGFDGTNLTVTDAGGTQGVDISGVSTDDQGLTGASLSGANVLQIDIEDGTSTTVDLSALVDDADADPTNEYNTGIGFDGTNLTVTDAGGTQSVDISGVSTDDQGLTGASLSGANVLQIDIEDGASTTVDLSALVDDADADPTNEYNTGIGFDGTNLTVTDAGGTQSVDISGVSTDDQGLSGASLSGANVLQIDIEDGTSTTVDLSALVDDADADPTNEYNTGASMNAGSLVVTDAGGDQSANLISADANNDISAGSDGALYLNVASVTISETITNLTDNADGTITYVNESGVNQTISKSDITDNGDGTYTFTNNDGSDVTINTNGIAISNTLAGNRIATVTDAGGTATDIDETVTTLVDNGNGSFTYTSENGTGTTFTETDDQTAAEVSIADTAGNFAASDVEGALAELATGSTDDQGLTGASLSGANVLQIDIENGTSTTVDLSALADNTDSQTLSSNGTAGDISISGGNNITLNVDDADADATNEIQDLGSVLTEGNDAGGAAIANLADPTLAQDAATKAYVDGLADDDISGAALDGSNVLTISEGTTDVTVDLSALVEDADADPTNEYNTGIGFDGTNLTVTDAGGTQSVDISGVSTDDQGLTGASLSGANVLQIDIEDGTSTTVDLSALVDDADADATNELQTLSQTGTDVTLSDGGGTISVADNDNDATNEYNTNLAVNAGNLELTDGGGTLSVPLTSLGTDDQALSLSGNTLTLEDGGAVDLTPYLDNTDDQQITDFSLAGTTLTLTLEDGGTQTVDLSGFVSTDDQDISTDGTAGNISIEDGSTLTLNVNDADADPANEYNTSVALNAGAVEVTDGGGTQSANLISGDANNDITAGSDGALYLNVASVTISETITNLADNGNGTFTYINENGVSQTVSKADVTDNGDGTYTFTNNDGTDVILDTRASSNAYVNTVSGLTATDVQGAIDELASGSTDDQALSLSGNTLTLEDGGTVDLTPYLDNTDDQQITDFSLAGTTLTLTLEDGGTQTVDLSGFVSTDDQNLTGATLTGTSLQIDIEDGSSATVDLSTLVDDSDADATNELQTLSQTGTDVTLSDGGGTISVADNDNDATNEIQDLGSVLTEGNDAGGAAIANLADPTLAQDAATKAYVDGLADDDISGAALNGSNVLTISEGTTDVTVDLSALVDDADADPTNEIQDLGSVLTEGNDAGGVAIANLADPTLAQDAATKAYVDAVADDDISGAALDGSNVLTISEGTTDVTVDLSALVDDADADPTNEYNTGIGFDGTNLTVTDAGGTQSVDISGVSTDDQGLTGASLSGANVLQIDIENGTSTTIDLSALADNTDSQTLSSNGTAGDISISGGNNITLNVDDADADPTNEIQTLSQTGTDVTLSDGGGTISVADNDNDATNEIQDLGSVLTEGNDAGGAAIANLADPTLAQDAATKAYVDAVADDDVTGAALDGSNVLTISEGTTDVTVDLSALVDDADADATNELQTLSQTGTDVTLSDGGGTISVADNDNDATNEIQDLGSVLTEGNDAGGAAIANLADPTLAQDAATKAYVDAVADDDVTGAALDGSNVLTISEGTTDVTVDLSALVDDADADPTNEYNTGIGFDGTNLTVTDAGGTQSVDISGVSTDDQGLTGASLSGANVLQIDIEDGTSTTVDLSALADNTDSQTLSSNGTAGDISISGGNNITLNVDDADADPTNEIQDLSSVLTEGNDAGGAAIANLADPTLAQDAATKAYVDGLADDDISGAALDGSNVLTISEGTTDVTVDLSALVDDADADPTNELQTLSQTGTDVTLSDGGGTISVADNDNDATNEIQDLGSVLTEGNDAGGAAIANLADPTLAQDAATKAYVDGLADDDISGAALNGSNVLTISEGTTDVTVDLSALVDDADADPTNEIQDLGSVLTEGNDAGGVAIANLADPTLAQDAATKAYVDAVADDDISGAALDGSNVLTISEGTTDVTVDLSALVDDADADPTNEYNTGIGFDGTNLTVTDAGGTQSVDISGVSTDDQGLTGASLSGANVLQIDIENGTSTTVDLSALADNTDSQTLSSNGTAGDISISGGNNITLNVDDADADATNEIQDLGSVLTEGNDAGGAAIANLADPTLAQDAATKAYVDAVADDDISGAALDGSNVLTISEGTTDVTVDLSALVDDADADATNEIQDLDLTANTLTITNNGSATPIDLGPYLDNTDDQTASEVNLDTAVDMDGDAANETTAEEVIQAIAPITSKAARVFYPPSIAIDASTNGSGFTVDLYAQYIAQFGTPAVASTGAPAAVPTYAATDLYYYVTFADPAVFANMSIDANGVLTYDIIGQPSDYNSLINVVFVVR